MPAFRVQIPAPPPFTPYHFNSLHSRTTVTRPSLRKPIHRFITTSSPLESKMPDKRSGTYYPSSPKVFQDLPLKFSPALSSVSSSWAKKSILPPWCNPLPIVIAPIALELYSIPGTKPLGHGRAHPDCPGSILPEVAD